jgi:hypothetical protein
VAQHGELGCVARSQRERVACAGQWAGGAIKRSARLLSQGIADEVVAVPRYFGWCRILPQSTRRSFPSIYLQVALALGQGAQVCAGAVAFIESRVSIFLHNRVRAG